MSEDVVKTRTIHMSLDVRGFLLWPEDELRRCLKSVDATRRHAHFANVQDMRGAFLDVLASGRKVVPIGERCEGYSDETGCPGHTTTEDGGRDGDE